MGFTETLRGLGGASIAKITSASPDLAGTRSCSFCQAGTQTKRGQRVGHEGYHARMGYVVKKCQHCGGRGWKFCSCIASFAADHKDEALAAIERLNHVPKV